MVKVSIKNDRINSTPDINDTFLKDSDFINAYWHMVHVLKKYDGQKLEISFKCKAIKQVEQKKRDTRQEPFNGSKYNRRKYHGGHAPEMTETEHMELEKQELNNE